MREIEERGRREKDTRGRKKTRREGEMKEREKRIGKRAKSERGLSRKLCQTVILISIGHR